MSHRSRSIMMGGSKSGRDRRMRKRTGVCLLGSLGWGKREVISAVLDRQSMWGHPRIQSFLGCPTFCRWLVQYAREFHRRAGRYSCHRVRDIDFDTKSDIQSLMAVEFSPIQVQLPSGHNES